MESARTSISKEIKEITEQLEQGLKELYESDKYGEYLNAMAKFHSYSFSNTVLIATQRPGATYVAGYTTWKKLGRYIKKGEKGIRIIAPSPYKKRIREIVKDEYGKEIYNEDGSIKIEEIERIIPAFKVVTVFDISQTEGKELPTITEKLNNTISSEDYEHLMKAINNYSLCPIRLAKITSGANGYYDQEEKEIVINVGMSNDQTIKTAIHEVAHSLLHDKDNGMIKDSKELAEDREVQAESIAYTVTKHFGMDSSDYSCGYIVGWSSGKELKELKRSLEIIKDCSNQMIFGISKELIRIKREMNINPEIKISNVSEAKVKYKMNS